VQVNLLPQKKQENLKAKRLRQLVITTGSVVLVVAIALPIVLFVAKSGQNLVLKRTQNQIDERISTIKSTPDITTMLTVKDHLASLPELYEQRLLVSELFKILPNVTPTQVKLSSADVSADGSITFTGTASSYSAIQKFFVALQRAGDNYDPEKVDPDPNVSGQFSEMVLESVNGTSGGQVSFTILGRFAQTIISGEQSGQ